MGTQRKSSSACVSTGRQYLIPYLTLLPHKPILAHSQAISQASYYRPCAFICFFIKSYVVGTHLNCLDKCVECAGWSGSSLGAHVRRYVSWPRGYKTFLMLNSAQHEIFSVDMKMTTTVVIFISVSWELFMVSYVYKKEFVIVGRFTSRTNFMLRWVEHAHCL